MLSIQISVIVGYMSFTGIQQAFFFGVLLCTTGVFLWMLGEYLLPVFWSVVVAIIFYPLHRKILTWVGERAVVASFITIATVIFVVALPMAIVGTMVAQESVSIYQSLTSNESAQESFSLIEKVSGLTQYLEPFNVYISAAEIENTLRTELAKFAETLAASSLSLGQSTFAFAIHVGVTIYLLFFMFKDGQVLVRKLGHFLPLGNKHEDRLFARFTETTRGVVQGTLTIAIIQGIIGGITFWIAGVSAPVLWGVAMTLLAIIPAIGPALVWFPAAIMLLLSGAIWEGIMILSVGILLVSVIDEFLRPILVGRRAKLPDAVVLLATIGGLATFGISGFVVGPIIAAFFISLWLMFEEKYRNDLLNK